jgi:GTP-binding protein HflX
VVELQRTDLSVQLEKAVLVAVVLRGRGQRNGHNPLVELEGLATTAGAKVVGTLVQRREIPEKSTYLGRGKVDELHALVQATDADVVIFDNDLTPGQTRNLEQALNTKVLDRSELILDIFATRARTFEARLQVELAQLQYALPRLKRMWTHLSRIEGGIGTRGPGEKQLEEDRRLVEDRITDLRRRLSRVEARRERQVGARSEFPTVSLVGYTNAGKSTLMNVLTGAGVLVEDKLFATLDTRTRRWQIPRVGRVLLSDTVGFIRDLPHHLVASFKATLEEARQADLLLHVVDASDPAALEQIAVVEQVLGELGAAEKPIVLALNKVDAIEDESYLHVLQYRRPEGIAVSARTGKGLDRLGEAVAEALTQGFTEAEVELDVAEGRLLAMIQAHGEILSRHYDNGRVLIHCRIPAACLEHLRSNEVPVRPTQGNGRDESHGDCGDAPV